MPVNAGAGLFVNVSATVVRTATVNTRAVGATALVPWPSDNLGVLTSFLTTAFWGYSSAKVLVAATPHKDGFRDPMNRGFSLRECGHLVPT